MAPAGKNNQGDSERGGDEVQGRWAQVQAPALRRELQRREAGEVVALVCLASPTATCALEPARLHSCSKFTTPGCYYSKASHEKFENHDMLHTRTLSFAAMTTSQICKKKSAAMFYFRGWLKYFNAKISTKCFT